MELKNGGSLPSIVCLLILLLLHPGSGFPQPRDPVDPKIPDVNLRSAGPEKEHTYAVTIDLQGMKSLKGKILLPDDKLMIPLEVEGERKSFVVQVSNIRSIEFLEWEWKENRKNSFIFYPVRVRINLERSYYVSTRNIRELNRLNFTNSVQGGREGPLYSIFYDYRDKQGWANLKSGTGEQRVSKPIRGTVTRIEFHLESRDFPDFFNIFRGDRKK